MLAVNVLFVIGAIGRHTATNLRDQRSPSAIRCRRPRLSAPRPGRRAPTASSTPPPRCAEHLELATMVRLGSCGRPAGESPVRVGVGAPGSRPRFVVERRRAERGVESLFGGSKRVGCDCSLVTVTIGEPSRSFHGEGHVRRSLFRIRSGGFPRGRGSCTRARSGRGTREARLPGLVSKDRPYKPMVKSGGGQRESEGAVVVVIGVKLKAAGAKGPRFDRGCAGGKR
jgi:hypothetical protein